MLHVTRVPAVRVSGMIQTSVRPLRQQVTVVPLAALITVQPVHTTSKTSVLALIADVLHAE